MCDWGSWREFGNLHYFTSNFSPLFGIDGIGLVGRRDDENSQSKRVDWRVGNDVREAEGRGEKRGGGHQSGRMQALLFILWRIRDRRIMGMGTWFGCRFFLFLELEGFHILACGGCGCAE